MSATLLDPADLYVVLERAFRRETRSCPRCSFSLPFRTDDGCAHGANWSVLPANCSPLCESILEDVVTKLQRNYRLR